MAKENIKTCINKILIFKAKLNTLYSTFPFVATHKDFEKYTSFLNSDNVVKNIPKYDCLPSDARYVENYFITILISFYMEKNNYDLKKWNEYVEKVHEKIITNYQFKIKLSEGELLEILVLHNINKVFKIPKVAALRANSSNNPTSLLDDCKETLFSDEKNKIAISKLKTTVKLRGEEEEKIWGDNDILIWAWTDDIEKGDIITIISCKTSLRERVYQSLFWAFHTRVEGYTKHSFITLDKGASGKSEIGTKNKPLKGRLAIESVMDRVYVFRDSNEAERSYIIKDFEYLKTDIDRWYKDFFGL